MSILISIENLLSGNFVENTRMEFKEGWNPTAVMRSVCAFTNDFENEGSDYIIMVVAEKNGKALRPVKGFDPTKFDRIQKELVGYCNLIQPSYVPRLSLEEIDDKQVLVIWTPAGSNRPYKVPDDVLAKHKTYNYRIRRYRNQRIGEYLKELNLTKGRGTGIPTIIRVLNKNGSDAPKFDTNEPERSFFVTELLIHPNFPVDENEGGAIDSPISNPIDSPISSPIDNLTDRQKEVLELLVKDNNLAKRGLAEKLDVYVPAVQSDMDVLKEKGVIKRIGGTREYWEIKK